MTTSTPPINRPSKIICAGLNYRLHAEEAGMELPSRPILFAKWPTSIIGPNDSIRLPGSSAEVDYEAELGVVIGRTVRDVSAKDALDAVAGLICANDISARDLQLSEGQWTRAKSFDTFCPVGPMVTPISEVGDVQDLRITCRLNDVLVQDDTTANMVFSVAELIAFASAGTTLMPGDLVLTGTPAGVAFGQDNPRYLRPGDTVSVSIEGVGTLSNPVVG